MQNKDEKKRIGKRGAMLVLSLCLVGGAAATTLYTMNRAEKKKEEQQLLDLNEQMEQEEAQEKTKELAQAERETEAEQANAGNVQAELPLANEMDVDPATLVPKQETEPEPKQPETEEAKDAAAVVSPTVAFDDATALAWPVAGSVVIDYSMDATVYFPTLNQYKYNPALVIGAETGNQVIASARGIVEAIDVNEETGTTLTLNLGNQYELVYGQLKEVTVKEGDVVETGQLLGYVSEPTKYYCKEGSNLYFEMKQNGEPVDPFLFLDTGEES